ncbi:MAG: 30S ribosomal protein S17e [Candidatus Aenigmatarchaeota archaeon]|nr:MAG: 30S ribosomal protein S17e [Candidatus Aenigmarchaeota archaeon]
MGSVKSVSIKNLGNKLIMEHGKKFSTDFDKNKITLNEIKEIKSKKVSNILAGYITRKMKQIEKTGV